MGMGRKGRQENQKGTEAMTTTIEGKEYADAEDLPGALNCPFCGKPLLNRPAGSFNLLGILLIKEPAMHYNPGCFLHSIRVSMSELEFGWLNRWNQRP